jgi:hypothetical protein
MSKAQPEKRHARRYPMKMPVTVQVKNGSVREVPCETRDVSQSGMFLYTDSEVHEGSEIEIVAMLPPEITQSGSAWVCCHARVVRVEQPSGNEPQGIAAVIERYAVLPEA